MFDDLPDRSRTGVDEVRWHVTAKIRARTKRIAGSRQNRDIDPVVSIEVPPDAAQLLVHRGIDRVLGLGTIQADESNPVSLVI
jgi:hypothetical protein